MKRYYKKVFTGVLIILTIFTFAGIAYSALRAEDQYQEARKLFYSLRNSKAKKTYRDNWLKCIDAYKTVVEKHPKSEFADGAAFMIGNLYHKLYGYSCLTSDLDLAISSYDNLIKEYPESKLSDDAQFEIGNIYYKNKKKYPAAYKEYEKVVKNYPKGDMRSEAQRMLKKLAKYKPVEKKEKPVSTPSMTSDLAGVTEIKHRSNPDYTRISIYIDQEVKFYGHLLKESPKLKKPPRLYIDLYNTKLSPDLKQPIRIDDGLLSRARAGQYTKDTVRVVLDIDSIESYKLFALQNPFRIIIDVEGTPSTTAQKGSAISKKAITEKGFNSKERLSIAQQLGLGIKKIVIDPGHGGKDPGAVGKKGLKEKDVVLDIAKKLKKIIEDKSDCEVILTREDDRFIPLEDRTAIANTLKADLFISVHANASRRRAACGVETYCLGVASDEYAMETAAGENMTSSAKISDLEKILADLITNSNKIESNRLAGTVQESMIKNLNQCYQGVNNLGVKQAPFYVLLGANMPSILVEVSFISNLKEEERLKNEKYRESISYAIYDGIDQYIKSIKLAYQNE